jgi:hypothetical protein
MKRFISALIIAAVLVVLTAIPVSAASLGISPSKIDIEVPGGGSTPVNFQVHYFTGELSVSLVDIPLEVEPTVFHITSSPEDIVVTFRDNTLNPQEYDGYVRFLSTGNATVGLAVNIIARVTVELSANIVEKPTPPPPVGRPPTYYTKTDLFGVEERFRIDSDGEILKTIEATTEDGMLTMTIPEGTIALGEDGKRLKSLQVAVDESPPKPPEDAHVIGLAYDFGPDGATFDPPLTLEYTYDPEALPEGVAGLVLAYYDEETGEWVELPCTVDPVTHTITASVAHFTTFAIIGTVPPVPPPPPVPPAPARFTIRSLGVSPSEVAPSEEVNISVLVANTGGKSGSYQVTLVINDLVEATKEVTVRAGLSKEVTFSVTREEADSYTVSVDGLSGSFAVVAPEAEVVPPEPAAFSLSSLAVEPTGVKPGEAVTVSIVVANTGGESGSYTVVLKIDGVKEAELSSPIAAGESLDVTFSVTREDPGDYTVDVDGLSGSFTVLLPIEPPGVNWALIGSIIGGVIVVGLGVFFWWRRRRAY